MTQWMQRLTNREGNFEALMQEISQSSAEPIDLDTFCENFLKHIHDTLHPQASGLFLKQKAAGRFHLFARTNLAVTDMALDLNHPLPIYLNRHPQPLTATEIDILPQFRALWEDERQMLARLDGRLYFPLKAGGDLVGILMLGGKHSEAAYSPDEIQKLTLLANQAALIIRLKYLTTAETRYRQETQTMQAAMSEMTAQSEVLESLTRTLAHVHEAFGYDSAYIALLQGDHLIVSAVQGFAPPEEYLTHSISTHHFPAVQTIVSTRQLLVVEETHNDPRFPKTPEMPHLSAWMGVPLVYQGNVTGVLVMNSHKAGVFQANPARLGLVQALANQAAVIVEISRLFKVEMNQRQLADILKNISGEVNTAGDYHQMLDLLMERISKVVPADIIHLFLKEGGRMDLARTNLAPDLPTPLRKIASEPDFESSAYSNLHYLAKSGLPVILSDAEIDPDWVMGPLAIRSWAGAPIVSDDQVIGYFTFASLRPGFYQPELTQLLTILSEQTALAWSNFRLNSEVSLLAVEDELTGLFNHRHFMALGEREFRRARRFHRELSVMLIDADQFQKVNETYGENAGNQVLRNVASVIQANVRNVDIPSRFQNEKFAVLLTETDRSGAEVISDRLRETIAKVSNVTTAGLVNITVSIGVAIMDSETASLANLLEIALQAMNEAKRNGRNRIVVYPKPSIEE